MSLSSRVRSSALGGLPLVLLAIAPQAQAVSASATLDWSALKFSVADTAPDDGVAAGITWLGGSTSGFQCPAAGMCTPLGTSDDWTTAGGTSVTAPSFAGQVAWSAASLQSTISGRARAEDVSLNTVRGAYFQFTGQGDVTVTLPFTVSVDATGGDAASGSFAWASLSLGGIQDQWYISSPWDGTFAHSGVLTATLRGDDGVLAYFGGSTMALLDHNPVLPPPVAAPVPEPATLAMLLGGLGLVAGATRRRRAV